MIFESITLGECIDLYEQRGFSCIIEDGEVTSFVKEIDFDEI